MKEVTYSSGHMWYLTWENAGPLFLMIWMHFFQLMSYLGSGGLISDLVDERTPEEKGELMSENEEVRSKIDRLRKSLVANEQALDIVENFNRKVKAQASMGASMGSGGSQSGDEFSHVSSEWNDNPDIEMKLYIVSLKYCAKTVRYKYL